MNQNFFASLRTSISHQRLDAYKILSTDTEIDLVERYFWNIALCESLYPVLQNIEIALRNSIYNAATISFKDPNWFDNVRILEEQQILSVKAAKTKIQKDRKSLTVGRTISELSFGFWTSLFDKKYDSTFWKRRDLIRAAFPNMPNPIRTRHILAKRFNEIRRLRNRVFHHESIWNISNLTQQHENIVEALDWLNPDVKVMNQMICDRFPTIYQQGSRPYREKLLNLASNLS